MNNYIVALNWMKNIATLSACCKQTVVNDLALEIYKIVLMSATLNVDRFVDYFSRMRVDGIKIVPPAIEIAMGNTHPVIYYYVENLTGIVAEIPKMSMENPRLDHCSYEMACDIVESFHSIDRYEHEHEQEFFGSVLIFLPGLYEIEYLYERLQKRINTSWDKFKRENKASTEHWWLCPLHSTVTFDEQLKVFKPAPPGHRKIILATNIAESSITVPDVKYVIDFCLMKMQVLETNSNFQSLQLVWISKSQGTQRAGRVGRVMPGRVYRLIPERMYEDLDENVRPEMQRAPLHKIFLTAKSIGIESPSKLLGRALDPPDLSNIHRTVLDLKEMGALLMTINGEYVEDDGDLTFIGRVMSSLPIDIRLSKLIVIGHMFALLDDCVIMACAMSVRNLFSTPFQKKLEAYATKLIWDKSNFSDPIAYLNAFKDWRRKSLWGHFEKSAGGQSATNWARRHFIQVKSMKEVSRLQDEVLMWLKCLGLRESSAEKVMWEDDKEKALALKVVIAGAFYPNYFLNNQIEEIDISKDLGERDPYSTVYLKGMPLNQPGILYVNTIKEKFRDCELTEFMDITFDGSSKAYIQFRNTSKGPREINLAVYRAVKLRFLKSPITLNLLSSGEALKRSRSLKGNHEISNFCWSGSKELGGRPSYIPNLDTNLIHVFCCYIENPSLFWVQLCTELCTTKMLFISDKLNGSEEGAVIPFCTLPQVHTRCVAPYLDNKYYRARVEAYDVQKSKVRVHYIDYGNSLWVNVNELMDFSEELIKEGVKDEAELAIQCSLSNVTPSLANNPDGVWSDHVNSLFMKYFLNERAFAEVYSAVRGSMSLYLFRDQDYQGEIKEVQRGNSFNTFLIKRNLANFIEEPYFSKENHLARQSRTGSSNLSECSAPDNSRLDMEILEKDCVAKVILRGPKSPLEMSLCSVAKKTWNLMPNINIESNSVNSVLLNSHPEDLHARLFVAGSITQSSADDHLILRDTTLLPNIHGLYFLIPMIFAPRSELRVDEEMTKFTGVVCGLGADPITQVPYNGTSDLELVFDTNFDLEDLQNINEIRLAMDSAIDARPGCLPNPHSYENSQRDIKKYIIRLLKKERTSTEEVLNPRRFDWGLVPRRYAIRPGGCYLSESIYPPIWGVEVSPHEPSGYPKNLQLLSDISSGKVPLGNGVSCEICQKFLSSTESLQLHLYSSRHRDAAKNFLS